MSTNTGGTMPGATSGQGGSAVEREPQRGPAIDQVQEQGRDDRNLAHDRRLEEVDQQPSSGHEPDLRRTDPSASTGAGAVPGTGPATDIGLSGGAAAPPAGSDLDVETYGRAAPPLGPSDEAALGDPAREE